MTLDMTLDVNTSLPIVERPGNDPDAHGQAALLLVEAMIHGLLEKGILSIEDALGIATAAAEVKEEIADAHTESRRTAQHSLQLIGHIVASLEYDRGVPR